MAELLDLKTVVKRDTIAIDDKSYEVLNLADLGPYEHQKLVAQNESAQKLLQTTKKLTAAQSRALDKALADVIKILVPSITPAVVKKLSTAQRVSIVMAWVAQTQTGDQGNPPRRRTGAASSRASRSSTAATRKRGSTARAGS